MRTSDPDRKLSISYEKVFREGTCGHLSVREGGLHSFTHSLLPTRPDQKETRESKPDIDTELVYCNSYNPKTHRYCHKLRASCPFHQLLVRFTTAVHAAHCPSAHSIGFSLSRARRTTSATRARSVAALSTAAPTRTERLAPSTAPTFTTVASHVDDARCTSRGRAFVVPSCCRACCSRYGG